jgi:peptidoglycan/LPS O-acetylase OafA/YrhL
VSFQAHVPRYAVHAFLLLPFSLLLWAVAHGGVLGRALGRPSLRALGEISYGLYLLQMPLFSAIGGKYEWSAARLGAFVLLLVAGAALLHVAVERPAQRWLLAFYSSRARAWWASASERRASQ